MGFQLPFNGFKMEVLNHLMVTPLQLHPLSRAYLKVFHYWCESLNGKPSLTFFFHLLSVQHGFATHDQGHGLIHLVPIVHGFRIFLKNLMHFENQMHQLVP